MRLLQVVCYEKGDAFNDDYFRTTRFFVDRNEAIAFGCDWGGEGEVSPYCWELKPICIKNESELAELLNRVGKEYENHGYSQ